MKLAVFLSVLCMSAVQAEDYVELSPSEDAEVVNTRDRRAVVVPTDIYPEVLLVIDYNLKKKIDKPDSDIVTYYRKFFGNIQRMYDSVAQPRFHFSLADIYICQSMDDCWFFKNRQINQTLHVPSAFLDEEGKWADGKNLRRYDLIMALSNLEMCKTVNPDGSCPRGVGLAGKAYLGGVCQGKTAVGVAKDDGGYGGTRVTAHEMGHLFGAPHDGERNAETCSGRDSYIMGGGSKKENLWKFSPCSQVNFAKLASTWRAQCLRRKEIGRYTIDMTMDGESKRLDEQCQDKYGPKSQTCPFMKNQKVCEQHFCSIPERGTCMSGGSALSGTPCGDNEWCYMSYGCVNKRFKPKLDVVDISSVLHRTTTIPPGGCVDSKRTQISVMVNGKSTACAEQFQLHPDVFCRTTWAHKICCSTARDNCEINGDVKVRGSTTPSDEVTTPITKTTIITTGTPTKPRRRTTRATTTAKKFCADSRGHHLKVVVNENESATDCPTQFNKHPQEFCRLSWVPKICCATVERECKDGRPKLQQRTTNTPALRCVDREQTHLRITIGGKMQGCESNFRDYPSEFCKKYWLRSYCCATFTANCAH